MKYQNEQSCWAHVPKRGFWHQVANFNSNEKCTVSKLSKKETVDRDPLLSAQSTCFSLALTVFLPDYRLNLLLQSDCGEAGRKEGPDELQHPGRSTSTLQGEKAKKERATICDLVMVMPTGRELEQHHEWGPIQHRQKAHPHTHPQDDSREHRAITGALRMAGWAEHDQK